MEKEPHEQRNKIAIGHRRGAEHAERTYFFLSVERTERKKPDTWQPFVNNLKE